MKQQFLNDSGLTELIGYIKEYVKDDQDVKPYASLSVFPKTGEQNIIYIDTTVNASYYWDDTSKTYKALDVQTWANLTGKPSTFPPEDHNHDDRYFTETEINSKLAGKADSSHTHKKADITDFPTSMPASDVPAWAKASTKPAYSWSEINNKPSTFTPSSHTHGSGDITSLSADKITGVIGIDHLPAGALERCKIVADDTARFKLTKSDIQNGDTVKVGTDANAKMYFVIDDTKLSSEAGYTIYTAGSATSVPWSGVTGKPSTFAPSSHTHDDRYYTESEMNTKLAGKSDTGHTHSQYLTSHQDISGKVNNNADGADSLFSKIAAWTATPTDDTYFIRQDTAGTNTFGRVKFFTLWNYIKAKGDSIYAKVAHSHKISEITDIGNASVNYANSAGSAKTATSAGSCTGNAATATALTSSAGSSTQPVYFSGGKPVACSYTINASVPSGAKFTDTNTWRGIQNNLTSDSTTDSLSAAQGKLLKSLVDSKAAASHTHTIAQVSGLQSALDGKAASVHSHSYLPLSGGTMTGPISYRGSKATYQMITFYDASDEYGNGIGIGGGGLTIIGGGESTSTVKASIPNGGSEQMIIANDDIIEFYTHCQDGLSTATRTFIDNSGVFSGTASMAITVKDYNNGGKINIGYSGAGISGDQIKHICGFTTGTNGALANIKDISKDNLKAWLGSMPPTSHTHDYVVGSYTANGGQQKPNYFGRNKVGFLMMNTTVNGDSSYKDWIIMDCYSGDDVGGGVALGVNRQKLAAYIMRSAASRTSWAESAELLHTVNYTSYTVTKTGGGASGTWGINVTGSAGSVAWGNVSGRPSSMPASDVYSWAKASSKPSYSWSEITGKPSTFTPSSHTHSYVLDVNGSSHTTFAYSKAGMNYADYTWLAAWNENELRAVNKSQFATASHTHTIANITNLQSTLDSKASNSNTIKGISANGYWGLATPASNSVDWIRTTSYGLLPSQSGSARSGHSALGTSSWYFSNAYIDSINTSEIKIGQPNNSNNGGIELYGASPYIDFHTSGTNTDYSSRIIAYSDRIEFVFA